MSDFDLLLSTDSECIEGDLRLVKNITMFIQRALAALFAYTFLKMRAATANRILITFIYTI